MFRLAQVQAKLFFVLIAVVFDWHLFQGSSHWIDVQLVPLTPTCGIKSQETFFFSSDPNIHELLEGRHLRTTAPSLSLSWTRP